MVSKCFLSFLLTLILSPWMAWGRPGSFDEDWKWLHYALQFTQLSNEDVEKFLDPFKGHQEFRLDAQHAPWATNYFPMNTGGIAQRWKVNDYPKQIHTKDSLQILTPKGRLNLSPVEKFDLWMGDYSFSATRHELLQRGPWRDPFPEEWEGFCNGARCAGLVTPEPLFPVTVKNPDGLDILFVPTDIKALVSASYFYPEKYAQLGGPSLNGYGERQPNPAIFDLVLRYFLAHHQRGFILDSHLGSEIWNETIVGFRRSLGGLETLSFQEQELFPGAKQKVRIEVYLETLGEVPIRETNHRTTQKVADGSFLTSLETAYTLYLDDLSRAVGGEWDNRNLVRGVDFVWFGGGEGWDHQYYNEGGNPYLKFEKLRPLLKQSTVEPIPMSLGNAKCKASLQ